MNSSKSNNTVSARVKLGLLYAASQSLYWIEISLVIGFSVVFMSHIGVSNSAIGLALAFSNLLCVFVSLLLAQMSDRRGVFAEISCISKCLLCELLLLSTLLILKLPPQATCLLYSLVIASILSVGPLYSRLYLNLNGLVLLRPFGHYRLLGSFCFAAMSFISGSLLRWVPLTIILIVAAVCAGLRLLMILTFKRQQVLFPVGEHPSAVQRDDIRDYWLFLREQRYFIALLLGIAIILSINSNIASFSAKIVDHLGGTPTTLGYLNGFVALVEVPAMYIYGTVKRKDVSVCLIIAFVFFAMKFFFCSAVRSIPMLFFAFSLQSVSYGLYIPAVVDHVRIRIATEHTGKALALLDSVPKVFTIAISPIMGNMLDRYSVPFVVLMFAFFSLFGVISATLSLQQ